MAETSSTTFAGVVVFDNEIGTGFSRACRIEFEWRGLDNFEQVKLEGQEKDCRATKKMANPIKFVSRSLSRNGFRYTNYERRADGSHAFLLQTDCSDENSALKDAKFDIDNLCLSSTSTLIVLDNGRGDFFLDRIEIRLEQPTRISWRHLIEVYEEIWRFETVALADSLAKSLGRKHLTFLKSNERRLAGRTSPLNSFEQRGRENISQMKVSGSVLVAGAVGGEESLGETHERPILATLPTFPTACDARDTAEHSVKISLAISGGGEVKRVDVVSAPNSCLGEAASRIARTWTYLPVPAFADVERMANARVNFRPDGIGDLTFN